MTTLCPEDQAIVDRAEKHIGDYTSVIIHQCTRDLIAALHAAAEREFFMRADLFVVQTELAASAERECVNCPYIERPDAAELKRLVEDVKTKWYGFAIGTHSGIDAVTASAALYAILGIPAYAEVEK